LLHLHDGANAAADIEAPPKPTPPPTDKRAILSIHHKNNNTYENEPAIIIFSFAAHCLKGGMGENELGQGQIG